MCLECRTKDQLIPIEGNQRAFYACVGRGSGYVIDCARGTFHVGPGKGFPCGCTDNAPPGEQPECSSFSQGIEFNSEFDRNRPDEEDDSTNNNRDEETNFIDKTQPNHEGGGSDVFNTEADISSNGNEDNVRSTEAEIASDKPSRMRELLEASHKRPPSMRPPLLDDVQMALLQNGDNSVDRSATLENGEDLHVSLF